MTRRFLDCSSSHLTPETWAWLDAQLADDVLREPGNIAAAAVGGGRTRYGWFLYAMDVKLDGLPADLRAVFAYARRRRAEYILFDSDAPPMEDLPVLHPDFADAPRRPDLHHVSVAHPRSL